MFGLGTQELVIILVLVLVIFGAGKLPQVGGALGKGIRNFKSGLREEAGEVAVAVEETQRRPRPNGPDSMEGINQSGH
jgi:sec-independent protein translocase protein TatA